MVVYDPLSIRWTMPIFYYYILQSPDIYFFCDNAPVSMVIIRADYVKIFYIFLYQMINLAFPEKFIL